MKAPEYRSRQRFVAESYSYEAEPQRSAFSEYSPIIFGGLMLVAAFAFAGHYIGRNASAHAVDPIEISTSQATTVSVAKGSLLGDIESFKTVELKVLRLQTVQSDGKGDMIVQDTGVAPAVEEPAPVVLKKKKAVAEVAEKRIKIEPASINLNAEKGLVLVKPKKLAALKKPVATEKALVLDKTEKRKVIANRRLKQAEENCLARAVYFEARSESELGQMAVAKVILNRTRSPNYPKSICGVVYQGTHRRNSCQFSFACDGLPDDVRSAEAWARSKRVAQKAIAGDMKLGKGMNAATNYHADYVKPKWSKTLRKIAKIGTHVFYSGG